MPIDTESSQEGRICGTCGSWVMYGISHQCQHKNIWPSTGTTPTNPVYIFTTDQMPKIIQHTQTAQVTSISIQISGGVPVQVILTYQVVELDENGHQTKVFIVSTDITGQSNIEAEAQKMITKILKDGGY